MSDCAYDNEQARQYRHLTGVWPPGYAQPGTVTFVDASGQTAPGTYRTEIDIEHRDPTSEAIALATIDHQAKQLEAHNQAEASKQQQRRIKQQQILDGPRFSRAGWLVALIAEAIAVCIALGILVRSDVGFSFSSVLIASACVLVPTGVIAGIWMGFDADVKSDARKVY